MDDAPATSLNFVSALVREPCVYYGKDNSMRPANLTQSLARWNAGDLSAEKELMGVIYPMLRALAHEQLLASNRLTLQATELANEAFIKLRATGLEYISSSQEFTSFVARMLRNMMVDHMRERDAVKRGGRVQRVGMEELEGLPAEQSISELNWIALDAALVELEREDASHAHLVELRYFLGYSIDKSAEHLGVSVSTANRMWRFARAFLTERMGQRE
jgi:RNA polymerase sigma factor (TIGR02999 family)